MKKRIILITAVVLIALLCGCGRNVPVSKEAVQSNKDTSPTVFREVGLDNVVYSDKIIRTFEDHLLNATDIMVAEFKDYQELEYYIDLEFTVKKLLKGETTADTIHVAAMPHDITMETETGTNRTTGVYNYLPGHQYLLVLERQVSVYYEYDRYVVKGDLFLPLDDDVDFYMYYQPMDDFTTMTEDGKIPVTRSNILQIAAEASLTETDDWIPYYGVLPMYTDDVEEAAAAAEYIFRIEPEEFVANGIYNGTETYECIILETLRGELSDLEQDGRAKIVFRKGDAKKGEEYFVFVQRVEEGSGVFVYAATGACVHSASDPAQKQAVYDALASD